MLGEDGEKVTNRIRMKVELVSIDRFEQFLIAFTAGKTGSAVSGDADELTVRGFIKAVARDFDEILGPDNKPFPFTPENLDIVIQLPNFVLGWGLSYIKAWNGQGKVREGNSGGSPAAGPAGAGNQQKRPARTSSSKRSGGRSRAASR